MRTWWRFGRFNVVGAVGATLQLALIAVLMKGCGLRSAVAAPIAVELVVLHNFLWHERFTWRDRAGFGSIGARLWRFHAGNGLVSLCGNTLLMYCFVDRLQLPAGPSALAAIAVCAMVNFRLADRWVYRHESGSWR